MTGRIRKKLIQAQLEALPAPRTGDVLCPLCERPIPPSQQDAHHLVPKSHALWEPRPGAMGCGVRGFSRRGRRSYRGKACLLWEPRPRGDG